MLTIHTGYVIILTDIFNSRKGDVPMKTLKKILSFVLCIAMVGAFAVMPAGAVKADIAPIGTKGSFNALSYNVKGLPIPSSFTGDNNDAYDNTILIGQLLNAKGYDIVCTQEDFNYDTYLRKQLTDYKYMTEHAGGVPLGDGLNVFTKNMPLSNTDRQAWEQTHGVIPEGDELTYKGFMMTTIKVADGVYIDYYDLHADAFGGKENNATREAEFEQLVKYINKHSANRAVIITGDFNCSLFSNASTNIIGKLIEPLGLNDAWAVEYANAYDPTVTIIENHGDKNYSYDQYYKYAQNSSSTDHSGYWGVFDSVERFLYRDGGGVKLSVKSFSYQNFFDASGKNLSDHAAALAHFNYEVVEHPQYSSEIEDDQPLSFLFKFLDYIASLFRSLGKLLENYFQWKK